MLLQLPLLSIGFLATNVLSASTSLKASSKTKNFNSTVNAKTSPSPNSKIKKPIHFQSSLHGSAGHASSYVHLKNGTFHNAHYQLHISDLADKYRNDEKNPTQLQKIRRSTPPISKNVATTSSQKIPSNGKVRVGVSDINFDFDFYGLVSIFPSTTLKTCHIGQGYQPYYDQNRNELRRLQGFDYPIAVYDNSDRKIVSTVQGDVMIEDFTFWTLGSNQLKVTGVTFLLMKVISKGLRPDCGRGTLAITTDALYRRDIRRPEDKNPYSISGAFCALNQAIGAAQAFAQISVGAVDPTNMKDVSSLVYYNVVSGGPDANNQRWFIQGDKVVLDSGSLSTNSLGLMVIDSLTPFILLPPALVAEIYASIGGSKAAQGGNPAAKPLYEFPCNSNASPLKGISLSFTFKGSPAQWQIASSDFKLSRSTYNPGKCVGAIQESPSDRFSVLGTSFLNSFVTVYEYQGVGSKQRGVRIGLATSINNKGTVIEN